jgi:hypothetical protein
MTEEANMLQRSRPREILASNEPNRRYGVPGVLKCLLGDIRCEATQENPHQTPMKCTRTSGLEKVSLNRLALSSGCPVDLEEAFCPVGVKEAVCSVSVEEAVCPVDLEEVEDLDLFNVLPTFAYSSYALIQSEFGIHRIGGKHAQGNLLVVAFVDESDLCKRGQDKSRVIV